MRISFPVILFFVSLSSKAQHNYSLEVTEIPDQHIISKMDFKSTFNSSRDREKEVKNILAALWERSYLSARIDSILGDSSSLHVFINAGTKYEWAYLHKGNVDEGILSDIGFRERAYRGRKLKYGEAARVQENILTWCENHGYPFASVSLDSVQFPSENSISASLFLRKNRFTKIDSIELRGNLKISKAYLYSYIGISPGDPYDESKLDAMQKKLKALPFAKMKQSYTVLFTEKYSKLTIWLDKKPAGQFDGIVGFQPDSRTGKILFTGDAKLKLQNSFGHGEIVDLNWRRLQEQTQDLKAHVNYPYLFRTPFGVDYNIKLYKRDTTYIDVNQQFGIQYSFSATNTLTAYVRRKNSNLLSTFGLEAATVLPPYADIDATTYGLKYSFDALDYRFNPRSGFDLALSGEAGTRNIRENAKLNPVVYENLTLRSTQYGGSFEFRKFWPFGKRSTILTGIQAASVNNSGGLFVNELFRIGGLHSLRGFDEESMYCSTYSVGTVEYRFLLEENSAFFLFFDGAWYEKSSRTEYITDTPFGFGTGVFFETKAGIFSMTYALGDQFGQGIIFMDGKIHIGFVGLF